MPAFPFEKLESSLEGSLHTDILTRSLYATDASVYRKLPSAVAYPRNTEDLKKIIGFADEHHLGLIPRTAGTSLAGQCVGEGMVVDVSRHFTSILDLDLQRKQVTLQPGVIRDELNEYLKPHGLFFGPNTSTSNRCMIGGMVGNNSSGTTSIQYGVTRDKVIALKTLLASGEEVVFSSLTSDEFQGKTQGKHPEAIIYNELNNILSDREIRKNIQREFPKSSIHRRNTGYAIDALLESQVFDGHEPEINLSKLLCGSEGTLAFITEITLQLDELPPPHSAMVVTHYETLEKCLEDVAPVMKHDLHTCEMMDKVILDCTENNKTQQANRFFVEGDPAALLMLEVRSHTEEDLKAQLADLQRTISEIGRSYASPVLFGDQINSALELRKAGLGLLGNMVGDRKAVACIEDTAVALEDLKDFIGEFTDIMKAYRQEAVYYAHAGAGELHLRPILNLKKREDVKLFREITTRVAELTKKYRGSFSGEHGDGIVRAEFIPMMIGKENYDVLRRIKGVFDPKNIFNPGKIVDPYPMDEALRYEVGRQEPEIETHLDFSDSGGILRATEKCNGSGDCRKTEQARGAMCPSYHATRNEKDTTRGRANALREFLTHNPRENKFDAEELKEVFDLCLSCKACGSECPSNVDVATLKAEFMYQYQEEHGYTFRNKLFAYNTRANRMSAAFPALSRAFLQNKLTGNLVKKISGVATERSIPTARKFDFQKYLKSKPALSTENHGRLILYIDEFTRYLDIEVGKDAIDLLHALGYEIVLYFGESGRTFISKGFLDQARSLASANLEALFPMISEDVPVVGLEPSAILSFRDEYHRFRLDTDKLKVLSDNSLLIEEFLAREIGKGKISSASFTAEGRNVKVHNHCHQKSLSDQKVTFDILNLPENYKVTIINSGCCGMAGSFGYEKEHYEVSMKIGRLRLFPAVSKADRDTLIAANGTSCRHQIWDGTGRKAYHPVSILRDALKP
ncbi:FAD-binding and (Fe-S)-binding domain-containing protein [Muriicola marianensis]|uniref:Oxidoreductase n=1 Tax=Muriicola marianensis TaxID=1324801 RepID=A0ABQ1QR98_9FLAO|nr:FAD-binding and (Fe-S)-binding domain-containing protein [Muriicola marianensis]GGD39487.1 oxidoreductase [Muriicola marianensis]